MVTPKPGIYPHVPFDEYLAWDALNASTMKHVGKSPAHAKVEIDYPRPPTKDTDAGDAAHCGLLEPERLHADFAVRPTGIDRRTKEGKATWAKFVAENEGKTIIETREHWDMILGMREAGKRHPVFAELVANAKHREVSIVWEDESTGLLCKARPDLLTTYKGWTVCGDLKTTRDARPWSFARDVASYGYHNSAAHYLDGLAALAPRERRHMIAAVEKARPFAIRIYELTDSSIEQGRQENRVRMATWAECLKTGIYPAYSEEIEPLEIPAYAMNYDIWVNEEVA